MASDAPKNERRRARLAMGSGAVLSLGEACELLPLADREARAWLVEQGLVSYIKGRPVVVWTAVLEHLRQPDAPKSEDKPKPRPRLGRTPL